MVRTAYATIFAVLDVYLLNARTTAVGLVCGAQLLFNTAHGQGSVTIGPGTETYAPNDPSAPIGSLAASAQNQYFFSSSRLVLGGLHVGVSIDSIAFYIATPYACSQVDEVLVTLYETTAPSPIASTWYTGPVASTGSLSMIEPQTGWLVIALDEPFVWNGGGLVLNLCSSNGLTSGQVGITATTLSSFAGGAVVSRWGHGLVGDGCADPHTMGTTSQRIPVLRLSWSPRNSCTQGTGSTRPLPALSCPGDSLDLGFVHEQNESTSTYQWRTAPSPSGPWTNVPTSGSAAGVMISSDTWYSCLVTCLETGATTSTEAQLAELHAIIEYCATYPSSAASNSFSHGPDIVQTRIGDTINQGSCSDTASANSLPGRYSNLIGTSPIAEVAHGGTVPVDVVWADCNNNMGGNFNWAVFADWNNDGALTGLDERLYQHTYNGARQFIVPAHAQPGLVRVRFVLMWAFDPFEPHGNYSSGETEDHVIRVLAPDPCGALPALRTTARTLADTAGSTVVMGLEPMIPMGAGYSFQWQAAPDPAGPWVPLSDDGPIVMDQPISTTWYRCQVSCSGAGDPVTSEPAAVWRSACASRSYPTSGPSCASRSYPTSGPSQNQTGPDITQVSLGGRENPSACGGTTGASSSRAGAYSNYTAFLEPIALQRGTLVPYSITVAPCSTTVNYTVQILVDWNQDGDFLDTDEMLINDGPRAVAVTLAGSFPVPPSALLGSTRLRVVSRNMTISNTQSSFLNGEVEDYCIEVVAAPCTTLPTLNTISSVTESCPTEPFVLSLDTALADDGLIFTWQQAQDPNGPWETVSMGGATIERLQLVTTWYRCMVTCNTSGSSTISTPLQVAAPNGTCGCAYQRVAPAPTSYYIHTAESMMIGDVTYSVLIRLPQFVSEAVSTTPGYNDMRTAPAMSAAPGEVVDLALVAFEAAINIGRGFVLYADWDQDGEMSYPDEMIYNEVFRDTYRSSSFRVPLDAHVGTTRIRMLRYSLAMGTAPPPAIGWPDSHADIWDVCFEVLPPEACSVPWPAVSTLVSDTMACAGDTVRATAHRHKR